MAQSYGIESGDILVISQHFEKEKATLQTQPNQKNEELFFSIKDCLNKIKLLDYHYSVANLQRKSYVESKNNLKNGQLFIEMDFKQKIRIGMSPRQINSEFFKQRLRFVLGIGLYYKKNFKIECINVNIISDNLGQKGFSVISALRYKSFYFYSLTYSVIK